MAEAVGLNIDVQVFCVAMAVVEIQLVVLPVFVKSDISDAVEAEDAHPIDAVHGSHP